MKLLSIGVALFGALALVQPTIELGFSGALLGIVALVCAATTFRSIAISSFLKIFVAIFSTETIVFGLVFVASRAGFWPTAFAEYLPPELLPLTVAVFSILVYAVARSGTVGQIMRIADRYFNTNETGQPVFGHSTRIEHWSVASQWRWSCFLYYKSGRGRHYRAAELFQPRLVRRYSKPRCGDVLATAHVRLYALRLRLCGNDGYRILRAVDARHPLASWLTDHFVTRWLAQHNHYRISLFAGQTDNPDQRISEDVFRFINGGSDGSTTAYGIYDFSILLISTLTSLVSFSVVLWDLSTSFTIPDTDVVLPGFLFWVALLYAAAGTLITHLIGRPLISLYFQRQHMEADFRFSLARLREYTEQVAFLGGEGGEQNILGQRFAALIANFLAVVFRRMRVAAFTHTFGQLSPIIPFIFTAPFYFARKSSWA